MKHLIKVLKTLVFTYLIIKTQVSNLIKHAIPVKMMLIAPGLFHYLMDFTFGIGSSILNIYNAIPHFFNFFIYFLPLMFLFRKFLGEKFGNAASSGFALLLTLGVLSIETIMDFILSPTETIP